MWVAEASLFGAAATALVCAADAWRARAAARADRLALRLSLAREAAVADTARRLASAAGRSAAAVRDEIARAAMVVAPAVDGILVHEPEHGALRCVFASGERFDYYRGSQIALDDTGALAVRALALGHRATSAEKGVIAVHPGDAFAVAVPLVGDRATCTAVLTFCARSALEPPVVDRLAALGDQASPAYDIALDRERDRYRAEYDTLTGLLTPRAFRQRLGTLIDRARFASHERLALLFVDTDRFKQWNDSYGHAAGDSLLRQLADVLRGAARSERDLVARNGGDEFCLVFTETAKAAAIERAEALRARIGAIDAGGLRPAGATANVRITASIGVAAFPSDAANANDLLEAADAAMYHSKRGGRDAVSFVGADGSPTRLVG